MYNSSKFDMTLKTLMTQGWISQRVRTSPNLGLVLGDIQIAYIVLS